MRTCFQIHLFLLFAFCASAFGAEFVIETQGREKVFYYEKNIAYNMGERGRASIVLADNVHAYNETFDLLLHFDKDYTDNAGNYRLRPTRDCRFTTDSAYSSYALYLPRIKTRIELDYDKNTFFGNTSFIGSFTIGFFLKPLSRTLDAEIFSKMGNYIEKGNMETQGIRASLRSGTIVWEFVNLFHNNDKTMNVILDEGRRIEQGVFHYHSVSYDAESGRLIKYLDGKEEQIVYVTESGDEYSERYVPYFSPLNENPAYIGGGIIGVIDEFSIKKESTRTFDLNRYSKYPGEIITYVYDLEAESPKITGITVEHEAPMGSDIRLFYRVSDRVFLEDNTSIPWEYVPNTFRPNESTSVRGRFLQVRLELHADASYEHTPKVNRVRVTYEEDIPPVAPRGLIATASDGSVTLTWKAVGPYEDVAGYKIYYGKKSGYYDEYNSPIVVMGRNRSSYTVKGLRNETLYYFTITAFDSLGSEHESTFAEEVYARPKSLYGR